MIAAKPTDTEALLAEVLDAQGWRVVLDVMRAQIRQHESVIKQRARAHDAVEVMRRHHMIESIHQAMTAVYRTARVEPPHDVEDLVSY